MGEPDQVEHEGGRNLTRSDEVWLLGRALDTVADGTVLDTGVTFDTAGGLVHDELEAVLALAECAELCCTVLVSELEHGVLDLAADLNTLRVWRLGCESTGLDCSVDEGCTLEN